MYNLFTKHPRKNANETWWQHCQFAVSVGIRLVFTAIIFVIHAVFPFVGIPRWLNLEDTIGFLERENQDRTTRKQVTNEFGDDDWATPTKEEK